MRHHRGGVVGAVAQSGRRSLRWPLPPYLFAFADLHAGRGRLRLGFTSSKLSRDEAQARRRHHRARDRAQRGRGGAHRRAQYPRWSGAAEALERPSGSSATCAASPTVPQRRRDAARFPRLARGRIRRNASSEALAAMREAGHAVQHRGQDAGRRTARSRRPRRRRPRHVAAQAARRRAAGRHRACL